MSRPRSVSLFPSPQNYNGLSTVVQLARKIDIGLFHFLYAHKDEDFLYFSDILKSCACEVNISAYACKIVKIFLFLPILLFWNLRLCHSIQPGRESKARGDCLRECLQDRGVSAPTTRTPGSWQHSELHPDEVLSQRDLSSLLMLAE